MIWTYERVYLLVRKFASAYTLEVKQLLFDLSDAETGIFREKMDNSPDTVTTDDLALCVTISSVTLALIKQSKRAHVFIENIFAPSQLWAMRENVNIYIYGVAFLFYFGFLILI